MQAAPSFTSLSSSSASATGCQELLDTPRTPAPSSPRGRAVRLVIVEGNISAGKSTLCRELARDLGYKVFLEPTAANPYLKLFYQDPKQYALPLQMWMLKHRFRYYLEAVKMAWERKTVQGVLLDRSIFSDWVFAKKNFDDGNISPEGYSEYLRVRHEMLRRIPLPDMVINLNVSPEECYRRIHLERQRDCESGIPLEYLQGLSDCYADLVAEFRTNNVDVIDYRTDAFLDSEKVASQLLARFRCPSPVHGASNCTHEVRQDIISMLNDFPSFGLESKNSVKSKTPPKTLEMDVLQIQAAETALHDEERTRNEVQTPSERKSKSRLMDNLTPTTITSSIASLTAEDPKP